MAGATIAAACVPSAGASLSFGPPETPTIRIDPHEGCEAWTWVVEDLLKEEGFTDVQFVDKFNIMEGRADIGTTFGNDLASRVDAGLPMVALGGTHVGCIQLWAQPGINSIGDLRGKRIVIHSRNVLEDPVYGMWVSFLAAVGVAPSEVQFTLVTELPAQAGKEFGPTNRVIENFVGGKADAVLALVEQGPALAANPKNPGRLIFDMAMDKPWSQYYCCLLVANRDWATANPVAAKRATRAVLRGIDLVTKDRAHAVAVAVQKKFTTDGQLMLAAIKDLPYPWREYDPAETVRFFALRLADAKLLKKTPAQILAQGTDFTFFRQMQRELKA